MLIRKGADLNFENDTHAPAVWAACLSNATSCLKALIEGKADINGRHYFDSWSLLHYTAKHNSMDCAKLLLKNGADIHVRSASRDTVLHMACSWSDGCVRAWLALGVDVNAQNSNGDTPLHVAVTLYPAPRIKHIKQLLQAGADPSAKNVRGEVPGQYSKNPIVQIMLGRARARIHQFRRVAILVMWIRANREHEYRYSVLPLVNEIMKYL